MIVKIAMIVLATFVAPSAAYNEWDGFVASWDMNTSTHFWDLPQTETAARAENWTDIDGIVQDCGVMALGLSGDPTVVVLYENDRFTGVQVAFRVSDVVDSGEPLNYTASPAIITKNINGEDFYTATAHIYKSDVEGSSRIEFKQKEGYLVISENKTRVLEETPYLLKRCIPTMGYHYYRLKNDTDCTTIYPWFLMSEGDNIIGMGFYGFGTPTQMGQRQWFETVPNEGLLNGVPDAPTCAVDAVVSYGSIFLHFWLVSNPKTITCS